MRWLIVLGCLAAACGDDDGGATTCTHGGVTYTLGDIFPYGDGCNNCSCTTMGISCTVKACDDAGVDANPMSCGPSGGCPSGPACGTICCGSGERCDNGVCKCASQPACGAGDNCEAAGPLGGDLCGSICCGASGPCPQ